MLPHDLMQFIQTKKNIGMDFVERVKREHPQGVYLYGAGVCLNNAVKFMEKYHVKIISIVDTCPRREVFRGYKIISLSDFLASGPDANSCFVISAPSAADSIRETISQYFPVSNIYLFEMALYVDFCPDVEMYRQYVLKHWADFSELYDNLIDTQSKETLICVLKGRISGDLSYFHKCYVPEQYYPQDIISFSAEEVMVELGSYNGDTLLEFIERCPKYKAVYCFEPSKECQQKLDKIAKKSCGGPIFIVPKGAWDCSTELKFVSDGIEETFSHIQVQECGGTEYSASEYLIETTTVDEMVQDSVTYMKMDVEGAEMRALRGAERQIRKNRPKLAVCVYHRIEDILDVWNYLRKLVPEYQFYLRHHVGPGATETVLYAVTDRKI